MHVYSEYRGASCSSPGDRREMVMKRIVAVVVMVGLFLIAAAPADARGGRGGGGGHGHGGRGGFHGQRFHGHHGFRSSVVIGTGVWLGPYWGPYGYPPYYPYEPVVVESQPQTFIQQSPAQSYWYYCEDAKAYYPYVRECPAGWLTVVPQAPPESQR
jgi:hypothetical protein